MQSTALDSLAAKLKLPEARPLIESSADISTFIQTVHGVIIEIAKLKKCGNLIDQSLRPNEPAGFLALWIEAVKSTTSDCRPYAKILDLLYALAKLPLADLGLEKVQATVLDLVIQFFLNTLMTDLLNTGGPSNLAEEYWQRFLRIAVSCTERAAHNLDEKLRLQPKGITAWCFKKALVFLKEDALGDNSLGSCQCKIMAVLWRNLTGGEHALQNQLHYAGMIVGEMDVWKGGRITLEREAPFTRSRLMEEHLAATDRINKVAATAMSLDARLAALYQQESLFPNSSIFRYVGIEVDFERLTILALKFEIHIGHEKLCGLGDVARAEVIQRGISGLCSHLRIIVTQPTTTASPKLWTRPAGAQQNTPWDVQGI